MSNLPSPPPPGDRLTDSPWLWLALFSAAALVALITVGPKYARRQQIIERKFRATQTVDEGTERGADPPAAGSGKEELLIPIWPLTVLSAAVLAASLAALARSRSNRTQDRLPSEAER